MIVSVANWVRNKEKWESDCVQHRLVFPLAGEEVYGERRA